MPTGTRPAVDFSPEQLRFSPAAGFTIRADFAGGEISSDLGALLLAAVDRRIGLMDRLTGSIVDSRHASYIKHSLRNLLTQRIFQIASGYEDGNDANALRSDPLFKLAAGRAPLDDDNLLACGVTFSRLEGALRRSDIYRLARALVEQFIAGYAEAPATITLDLDHTDDATYGQQALAFYNHHYGHYCYLPLLVFEANSGALVTAVLRPGKRPTGAENAMIMKRVLGLLRQHWPQTHILLRGDGHFSNPELMQLIIGDGNADFIFGLAGNPVLLRQAEGLMKNARGLSPCIALWPRKAWGRPWRRYAFLVTLSMRPSLGRKPFGWWSRRKSCQVTADCPPKTTSDSLLPHCAARRPARSTSRTTAHAVRRRI